MNNSFKQKFSFNKRLEEAQRIKLKYEDKIPIVVYKSKDSTIKDIDRNKFLVPSETTISQFLFVVRKRITLAPEESIYLFINDSILANSSETIGSIYNKYKDDDEFLYITYATENVFG